MGSTTRAALAVSRAAIADTLSKGDLAAAEEILAAGRVIGDSLTLRTLLSEAASEPAEKTRALTAVFSRSLSAPVLALLGVVVSQRWSDQADLLAAIEELGIRVAAGSAAPGVDVGAELAAFGATVSSSADLELAINSKLSPADARATLATRLLGGAASAQTVAIVRHLVLQPRGRRIYSLLRDAAAIVADQAGAVVATVTSATALSAAQLKRIEAALAESYGRAVSITLVLDPALIGGVRVQIGDDVIDGSVAARLQNLRLQLAG